VVEVKEYHIVGKIIPYLSIINKKEISMY